jgi:phenylalanyl-tRNA synthetase beta chain
MANSLTTASYIELSEMLKEEHNVTMLNPLSNDLATLRQSLLFSGLEAISYNINRRNSNLKLFEFGKSYHKFLSGFEEHKHLTLFLTGNRAKESWTTAQNRLTSSYLKAMLMLYSLDLEFKKHKIAL